MKDYSKVAVALIAGFASMIVCESVNAQTIVPLSQIRAAQARGKKIRIIRVQRPRVVTRTQGILPAPKQATAQKPTFEKSKGTTDAAAEDKIPEAALESERGRELASRLRNLRFAESQLGSKHPSLVAVKKEIGDIKQELQTWKTASTANVAATEGVDATLAKLSEDELRKLVVRLASDVNKLRSRVVELESAHEKISGLVVERN